MTMINEEDRLHLQRAAVAQGVANSRQAALARAVLAFENALGDGPPKGSVGDDLPSDLAERVDRIEAAVKTIEVPDVEELEQAIGALQAKNADLEARLGRLEAELGGPPPDSSKKKR